MSRARLKSWILVSHEWMGQNELQIQELQLVQRHIWRRNSWPGKNMTSDQIFGHTGLFSMNCSQGICRLKLLTNQQLCMPLQKKIRFRSLNGEKIYQSVLSI